MMDHNTNSIGDLIKAFMKQRGLDERMEEIDINNEWEDIAGTVIAKHTVSVKLKGDTLILQLNSAALRHTLGFAKAELIEKLNERFGHEKIKDISLR